MEVFMSIGSLASFASRGEPSTPTEATWFSSPTNYCPLARDQGRPLYSARTASAGQKTFNVPLKQAPTFHTKRIVHFAAKARPWERRAPEKMSNEHGCCQGVIGHDANQ